MGYKKLSNEQEKQLVQEYLQGESVSCLMTKYGFKTKKSIIDKVKKHLGKDYQDGIKLAKRNRRSFKYSFDKINNEFDAYFLGLLLTDGYITTRGTDIGIDLNDQDCISFLAKGLNCNYYTYVNPATGKNKYRIILSSKEEVEKIARFGVIQNKSLSLQGPKLLKEEEKFIPYIIRGIIDGDGSIGVTPIGTPIFSICSASKDFILWIKECLENKMYMQDINILEKMNDKNLLYEINNSCLLNIYKLLALSYNKDFGMNRKYKKLKETFRDYNGSNLLS